MYLSIISAMITPAILILAAGSLVNCALTRIARIVDRARLLIERVALHRKNGDERQTHITVTWLVLYQRRAHLVERALTMFYVAIGMFVASSLAITLDRFTQGAVPWLSVVLVIIGVTCLLVGTLALVIETHLAAGSLRHEIEVGTH